jgi:hypothetical protein
MITMDMQGSIPTLALVEVEVEEEETPLRGSILTTDHFIFRREALGVKLTQKNSLMHFSEGVGVVVQGDHEKALIYKCM